MSIINLLIKDLLLLLIPCHVVEQEGHAFPGGVHPSLDGEQGEQGRDVGVSFDQLRDDGLQGLI